MGIKHDTDEESHVQMSLNGSGGELKGPSTFTKAARILFGDDPLSAFKAWRAQSVEPTIRKLLWEGAGALIYGHPVNVNGSTPVITGTGLTPYNTMSSGSSVPSTALASKPTTGGKPFNGTVFFDEPSPEAKQKDPTLLSAYQQARQTYEEMVRILKDYNWVRLAELYEIASIPGIEYVSNAWGWSDLTGTNIYPSGTGYILQLPPVRPR